MTCNRQWRIDAFARAQRRMELFLSLATVAERIGVPAATLARWEHGGVRPRGPMDRAWAEALWREVP